MKVILEIPEKYAKAITVTCIGSIAANITDVTVIAAKISNGDRIIVDEDGTFEVESRRFNG